MGLGTGALLLGSALEACTDGTTAIPADRLTPSAVDNAPVSEAVGYDRLVLHAGPDGQIERNWSDHEGVELVRPDGTVVAYRSPVDRSLLNTAHDAVRAPDGTFWVTDAGNGRLIHLGPGMTVLGTIDAVAGRRLSQPQGITMAGSDLVIADRGVGLVAITDGTGKGRWLGTRVEDLPGVAAGTHRWSATEAGVLDNPKAVEMAADGSVVVFDNAAKRLTTFGLDGTARSMIALSGAPTGFALDPKGNQYLADVSRRLVYRIDVDGDESPIAVVDHDRTARISERDAAVWQPYRLTWRTGTDSSTGELVVSLLPAAGPS